MKTEKSLLSFYRERWKSVDAIEQTESRNRTMDERMSQISALFVFARSTEDNGSKDVQDVRNRWIRLKDRYNETHR